MGFGVRQTWIQIYAVSPYRYETWASHNFSEPWLLPLQNGDNASSCFILLLGGLNEMKNVTTYDSTWHNNNRWLVGGWGRNDSNTNTFSKIHKILTLSYL